MLENVRQKIWTTTKYVVFGTLIAVFIISFGPQAGSGGSGCATNKVYAARVGSADISHASFRYGLLGLNYGSSSGAKARRARVKERVMDRLIERELLAQAAEEAGFRLDQAEIEKRIAAGEAYILGIRLPGEMIYFQDGRFDYDYLKRYARSLDLPTVAHFIAEQKREVLAQEMRTVLTSSVRVSPEEVLQSYRDEHTKAWVRYVRFPVRSHAESAVISPEDIQAYTAKHDEELRKEFEANKPLYSGRGKELRIRHVLVKKPTPQIPPSPEAQNASPTPTEATAEATGSSGHKLDAGPSSSSDKADGLATTAAAATAAAGTTAGMAASSAAGTAGTAGTGGVAANTATEYAIAKAKAAAVLARIQAGEDFATVAREVSDDAPSASRGGDLGWQPANVLRWGPEFLQAIQSLEDNKASGIVETARGFHLVRLEGRREGDLTYDQVKNDLAEDRIRKERGREGAREAADKVLELAKAGTPLDKQLTPPDTGGTDDAATNPPDWPTNTAKEQNQPRLVDSGELRRRGDRVGELGKSSQLAKAVFEELTPGQTGDVAYETGNAFLVVELVKREEPDMKAFERDRETLASGLAFRKAYSLLEDWTTKRCREQQTRGRLEVNQAYVSYEDTAADSDKPKTVSEYQACSSSKNVSPLDMLQMPPE
ncbi:MAG: peptidylprolyl isomerase [Pseudomonadota bacterium]